MIQLHHISKAYQQQIYFRFSYTFPEKGIVCLFAPSGFGKTTLFHLLLGLEDVDDGRIHGMEGIRTSVVFQENRLLPWKNGMENIAAVTHDIDFCKKLVKEFGLEKDVFKYPNEMSGGMQRQVSILRALAYDGDVFFLDEPFQGIDMVKKEGVMAILRRQLSQKLTFFITHQVEEVYTLADEVLLLKGIPLVVEKRIERKEFISPIALRQTIESVYETKTIEQS